MAPSRRLRRAYRCDVSTRVDWRMPAVIPLAIDTMLTDSTINAGLRSRYLPAFRDHPPGIVS